MVLDKGMMPSQVVEKLQAFMQDAIPCICVTLEAIWKIEFQRGRVGSVQSAIPLCPHDVPFSWWVTSLAARRGGSQ